VAEDLQQGVVSFSTETQVNGWVSTCTAGRTRSWSTNPDGLEIQALADHELQVT
jgi:hypothetical protein